MKDSTIRAWYQTDNPVRQIMILDMCEREKVSVVIVRELIGISFCRLHDISKVLDIEEDRIFFAWRGDFRIIPSSKIYKILSEEVVISGRLRYNLHTDEWKIRRSRTIDDVLVNEESILRGLSEGQVRDFCFNKDEEAVLEDLCSWGIFDKRTSNIINDLLTTPF